MLKHPNTFHFLSVQIYEGKVKIVCQDKLKKKLENFSVINACWNGDKRNYFQSKINKNRHLQC